MLQKSILTKNWGLGLSDDQAALLRSTLGEEHQLTVVSGCRALAQSKASGELEPPLLIWMSSKACAELNLLPDSLLQDLHSVPKIVLLGNEYDLADFETASDNGIMEILRPPLSRGRIADIMRRALEVTAIHHDMECMAREIALERELLERKNEILSFLVNFLTISAESFELKEMLQAAYQGLGFLLPLRSLHAVFWEKKSSEHSPPALSLYLSTPENSPARKAWQEALLEQARTTIGANFSLAGIHNLHLCDQPAQWARSSPEDGAVLVLPLRCGTEQLGALMLLSSMERHLGRDQAMALDSAIRHFSLAVKTARHFTTEQMQAGYDTCPCISTRKACSLP